MSLVSIVIPNYNHAPFLIQRIESVLNQTFQSIEVIILDDCSTDNSRDIIEHYRSNEKVSCIIYNEVNSGSTFKQWNKGVSGSKGKYIWIAESDDIADKYFLEMLVKKLDVDPDAIISYCQSYRISGNGELRGDWKNWTNDIDRKQIFASDFSMDGNEFIQKFLLHKNVLPNASAVLFKKEAFENVGHADHDIKFCSDWLLWMKLLTKGKLCFTATPLNYFRYHDKSVIAQTIKTNKFYLQYDIKMRHRFNLFLTRQASKDLFAIKILNTTFIGAEYSAAANEMLSIKRFSKAFYFLLMAFRYSINPERKKIVGLFIYNFRKAMRKKNKYRTKK